MKISTGLLIATTLFRSNTNINVQPKQPLNTQDSTEKNELLEQERIDSYTNPYTNIATDIYQLNGKQKNEGYTIDIEGITLRTQADSNDDTFISTYLVLTVKQDRPNDYISITDTLTFTGEAATTFSIYIDIFNNLDDSLDIYLDPEYIKDHYITDITNGESATSSSTVNFTATNYSYFNEQYSKDIEIATATTYRLGIYYEIRSTSLDDYNAKPENIEISYYVYVPTQEVIDLAGLLFYILTMPFSFISQAFNLTLFPNTPYAINVSNLLFALIAAAIIIIIIRKVIK